MPHSTNEFVKTKDRIELDASTRMANHCRREARTPGSRAGRSVDGGVRKRHLEDNLGTGRAGRDHLVSADEDLQPDTVPGAREVDNGPERGRP